MDYSNLPTILAAVTGLLGSFGIGIKYTLNRMDRLDQRDRDWQAGEQKKLETLFAAQIEMLKQQIDGQNEHLSRMRSDINAYVRHVGMLEGLLKANGIEVPPFQKA